MIEAAYLGLGESSRRNPPGWPIRAAYCVCLIFCFILSPCRLAQAQLSQGRADEDVPEIRVTGEPEVIFRKSMDACDPTQIPDAPVRAFRDQAGRVHMFASSRRNYFFVGDGLNQVHNVCQLIYEGRGSADPGDFDDRAWLSTFYTLDGNIVYGFIHDEFHGNLHPPLCEAKKPRDCWYNAVAWTVSRDGGYHFEHGIQRDRLIAALPYRYDEVRMPAGYFSPSNIVQFGAFHYMLAWMSTSSQKPPGACLLRNDDISDQSRWRGWDGNAFSIQFVDPYRARLQEPQAHLCKPVGASSLLWPVNSLLLHSPSGQFVAVMQGTQGYPKGAVSKNGVYASFSRDLINWSPPVLVMEASTKWAFSCQGPAPIMAPALLDAASPSRNFETLGDTAFLYFSRLNVRRCKLSLDIDLMRVAVSISFNGRTKN